MARKWIMAILGVAAAVLAIVVIAWVVVVHNVETPAYNVVGSDGKIEIRDYPPLVVAEVARSGDRKEAVSSGFRPLANYIFAKDRGGEGISMTAPVTQERIAMTAPVTQTRRESTDWVVRFIMPSQYTLETLPKPGGTDVRLEQLPARRIAAVRFSGVATDELIAQKEDELRAWLEGRGLETRGEPTYAYYNDPFTPGFLRRNEVMIEVAQ
jgi:DNA gyrase inhibitor GyrI